MLSNWIKANNFININSQTKEQETREWNSKKEQYIIYVYETQKNIIYKCIEWEHFKQRKKTKRKDNEKRKTTTATTSTTTKYDTQQKKTNKLNQLQTKQKLN